MIIPKTIFFIIIFFFIPLQSADAITVAIFPIEDMSNGVNGVSFDITESIGKDLIDKGIDVISGNDVIAFMSRNRIRRLGYLDTRNIFQAKDEIGADFILYGTVYSNQSDLPAIGLNLYLVRTSDARIIWSNSGGLSRLDVQNLLGLSEPNTLDDLMNVLKQSVLATWPDELEFGKRQHITLEIDRVDLSPKYLRPGDEVKCSIRLRPNWSRDDEPRVFFKVKGRVFLATENIEKNEYEASWGASDKDGSYPVTVVVNWPSGNKKVAFIGTYQIDSKPPQISLNLKGVRLQGAVAFRDQILIIPHMMEREPISRWRISVINERGDELMSDSGEGMLPQRFVWKGQKKSGKRVDEGIYQIILKGWDRANNLGIASQHVLFARKPPEMVLEAKNEGNDIALDISNNGRVPIAFWRLEMINTEGKVVKTADGESLPARIDIASSEKEKLKCVVVFKDVLGNVVRKEINDLSLFASQKQIMNLDGPQQKVDALWVEEF